MESKADRRKRQRASVEWVWINLYNGGTFEKGSLRPGTYDVVLKKSVYVGEGGVRRSTEDGETIPMGTIVIKPGETVTKNFPVP